MDESLPPCYKLPWLQSKCQIKEWKKIFWIQEGRDDDAMADFQVAAEEGSGFAKSMLVEMNPYAAMCNAMLKNVFTAMSNGGDNEMLMEKNLQNKSGWK